MEGGRGEGNENVMQESGISLEYWQTHLRILWDPFKCRMHERIDEHKKNTFQRVAQGKEACAHASHLQIENQHKKERKAGFEQENHDQMTQCNRT
jgi:hypothetical protein